MPGTDAYILELDPFWIRLQLVGTSDNVNLERLGKEDREDFL